MLNENRIQQLTILLVEDSETDAYTVKRALTKHMNHPCQIHHVETMADAEKALSEEVEFNMILLDLGLPDTSGGKDTYERITEAKNDTPVIILTSVHDHELAVGFVENGAEDFVRKSSVSADPEVLCDAIDFAVCRHHNLEELKEETNELIKEKDKVIHWMSGGNSAESEDN